MGGLRQTLRPALAVVASAAIFAAVHPPISMAPVFIMGAIAAVAFERTRLSSRMRFRRLRRRSRWCRKRRHRREIDAQGIHFLHLICSEFGILGISASLLSRMRGRTGKECFLFRFEAIQSESSAHSGRFHRPVCARREGLARYEIDDGD